jgi:hypothetical protein
VGGVVRARERAGSDVTSERLEWVPERARRPVGHGGFMGWDSVWYAVSVTGALGQRAHIRPREPQPNGDEWEPSHRSSRDGLGYAPLPVQWSQPYALQCAEGAHIVRRDSGGDVMRWRCAQCRGMPAGGDRAGWYVVGRCDEPLGVLRTEAIVCPACAREVLAEEAARAARTGRGEKGRRHGD